MVFFVTNTVYQSEKARLWILFFLEKIYGIQEENLAKKFPYS